MSVFFFFSPFICYFNIFSFFLTSVFLFVLVFTALQVPLCSIPASSHLRTNHFSHLTNTPEKLLAVGGRCPSEPTVSGVVFITTPSLPPPPSPRLSAGVSDRVRNRSFTYQLLSMENAGSQSALPPQGYHHTSTAQVKIPL